MLLGVSTASAADFFTPEATSSSWNGCYFGAHVGAGRATADATDSPFTKGPFAGTGVSWNSAGGPHETISSKDTGFVGGVEAGCDRQFDFGSAAFVLGGVVDFDITNLSGTATSAILSDTHASFGMDWTSSARGRAGVAVSDVLFYGTGGVAIADINVRAFDNTIFPTQGLMDVSKDGARAGWVAGAGAEWRIKPQWSIGVEYLHYDFGSITATGAAQVPTGAFPRFKNDVAFDTVRVGLKWRF
jgi:outer membrane immunogenic protein